MATTRTFMVLAGMALSGVALLAAITRLFGVDLAPFASHFSDAAFWAVVFVTFLAGILSWVFAPPTRTSERRVDLKTPVAQDSLVRPGGTGPNRKNLPVTRTAANPSRTPKKIRSAQTPGSSQGSHGSQGSQNSPGSSPSLDRKQSADHEASGQDPVPKDRTPPPSTPSLRDRPAGVPPISPSEHEPPSARTPPAPDDPCTPPHLHEPSTPSPPQNQQAHSTLENGHRQSHTQLDSPLNQAPPSMRNALGNPAASSAVPTETLQARQRTDQHRLERRQQELEERLQTLENRANAAKVSLGLARISKAGYLQYIKEMERERALIEEELMTMHQGS